MLVIVAAAGATRGERVVRFAGGSTSIEAEGGVDHVVVRDEKGAVTAESRCDAGTFDEYLALFTKFRDAVSRPDPKAVIDMVAYPFRVNGKKRLVFRNAESLSKRYDDVFTPAVQTKVRKAEPAAVFCRNGRAMFGDGVVWASPTGLDVLNP